MCLLIEQLSNIFVIQDICYDNRPSFFLQTTNSNIRFILTSSSSGDTGNVANNGEDISFNSLVEIYDRFKGFVIDMEI